MAGGGYAEGGRISEDIRMKHGMARLMGVVGWWLPRIVCWIKRKHDFVHYPEWPDHYCCYRCGLDVRMTEEEMAGKAEGTCP